MSMVILIACVVFILVYAGYILLMAYRTRPDDPVSVIRDLPQISVLIPCRNEARNIEACLQGLQRQSYDTSSFEILLIDDGSEDGTVDVASSYLPVLPLRILHAVAAGKKNALQAGISAARFPLIITLDADCWMGPSWLKTMATAFVRGELDMLCGPVNLEGSKGLFKVMQQAESAAVVGISAAMLNMGKPATCNGANLMFRKSVFEKIGGYEAHMRLASGDDDLLMHRFFKHDPKKTAYLLQREALVYSCASVTIREFFYQRLRWISKGKAYLYPYNLSIQVLVIWHLAAFHLLVSHAVWHGLYAGICFLLVKYAADLVYGVRLKKIFDLKLWAIVLMPFYQLYILVILFLSPFIKAEWKKRKIG